MAGRGRAATLPAWMTGEPLWVWLNPGFASWVVMLLAFSECSRRKCSTCSSRGTCHQHTADGERCSFQRCLLPTLHAVFQCGGMIGSCASSSGCQCIKWKGPAVGMLRVLASYCCCRLCHHGCSQGGGPVAPGSASGVRSQTADLMSQLCK